MPDGILSSEDRKPYHQLEKLVQETCSKNRDASLAKLLDQAISQFHSIASNRGEDEEFGHALLTQVLPAWTRRLDS